MQCVIFLLMHICIIHACEKFNFIKEQNVKFKDHVITTMTTPYVEICWDRCVYTTNCFSINARNTSFGTVECDLNNSSKKASPGSLVPTQGSQYYQMGDSEICDKIGCTLIKEDVGGGWYRINNALFKMFHQNKTWTDARAHCQSIGADLASIRTTYEKLFIPDLFWRNMTSNVGFEIGLPDKSLPGLYTSWALQDPSGDVVLKGTPSPSYEVLDGVKALYLPGFKAYAEIPAVQINPEGYTFMFWFKLANQSNGVTHENLYSDWSTDSKARFYFISVRPNKLYLRTKKQEGGTQDAAYAYYDKDSWNHIAVTWNNSTGKVRITRNGTQNLIRDYIPILPTIATTFHLGVRGAELNYNYKVFHGYMRNLMVFNNSMTDQEIQAAINYGQQSFWIGLNALNNTSTFQWSDGTTTKAMVPTGRFKDDPISSWPRCAAVGRDDQWMVKRCVDVGYFVCRKPFP